MPSQKSGYRMELALPDMNGARFGCPAVSVDGNGVNDGMSGSDAVLRPDRQRVLSEVRCDGRSAKQRPSQRIIHWRSVQARDY